MSDLPRIVCLDCMRDVDVLYRDEYDPARRADLVRAKCVCVDVFVWIDHQDRNPGDVLSPVLLGDCRRATFTQEHIEQWERLATQAMSRCHEVMRWMKETAT